MMGYLDVATCLLVACILLPLGAWGRAQADSLVVDAIQGQERDERIAVLRRGALTCQVLSVVFFLAAFVLLVVN
ncbi:hypothetical protein [Nocardioides daejeonensis]|uniref:hypothetical protein n=1 Tax=Nocardioides daejeonensis TaxID=1046556 RepID=UPI000D74A693|nr:hypothetical protein [Nocardioides daejeonensis]